MAVWMGVKPLHRHERTQFKTPLFWVLPWHSEVKSTRQKLTLVYCEQPCQLGDSSAFSKLPPVFLRFHLSVRGSSPGLDSSKYVCLASKCDDRHQSPIMSFESFFHVQGSVIERLEFMTQQSSNSPENVFSGKILLSSSHLHHSDRTKL